MSNTTKTANAIENEILRESNISREDFRNPRILPVITPICNDEDGDGERFHVEDPRVTAMWEQVVDDTEKEINAQIHNRAQTGAMLIGAGTWMVVAAICWFAMPQYQPQMLAAGKAIAIFGMAIWALHMVLMNKYWKNQFKATIKHIDDLENQNQVLANRLEQEEQGRRVEIGEMYQQFSAHADKIEDQNRFFHTEAAKWQVRAMDNLQQIHSLRSALEGARRNSFHVGFQQGYGACWRRNFRK